MKSLPKPKKCRVCPSKFQPFSSTQVVCSGYCDIKLRRIKKEKAFDAETARRREAIKTQSDLVKEVQDAFNKFIRARDWDKPCITCGEFEAKPVGTSMWDAGHFKSKQSHGHLRFNELAVHREHSSCNRYTPKRGAVNRNDDMTHDTAYRVGLVERIGLAAVEVLEGPHELLQLSKDDLRDLRTEYKRKAKEALKHSRIQSEAMQS
jgi:hypothetical protein